MKKHIKNPQTKALPYSRTLVLFGIAFLFGGCSGSSQSVKQKELLIKKQRTYTQSEIQYRYDHFTSKKKNTPSIEESQKKFDSSMDKTFLDIKNYKKELRKREFKYRNPQDLEHTGKNSYASEKIPRHTESKHINTVVKNTSSKKKNITKYY